MKATWGQRLLLGALVCALPIVTVVVLFVIQQTYR